MSDPYHSSVEMSISSMRSPPRTMTKLRARPLSKLFTSELAAVLVSDLALTRPSALPKRILSLDVPLRPQPNPVCVVLNYHV